jgi:DNA-binding transcriptional regulator YiaG
MYHYRESGLKNIWLRNGYRIVETPYGEAVEIEKVEQLHRAIARAVTTRSHLTGREFRFLRGEMNLSQEALARMLGNSAQSVALWEKGRGAPKWADRLIRALYREHAEGNVSLKEIFARAEAGAGDKAVEAKVVRLNFEKTRGAWRSTESAAKAA